MDEQLSPYHVTSFPRFHANWSKIYVLLRSSGVRLESGRMLQLQLQCVLVAQMIDPSEWLLLTEADPGIQADLCKWQSCQGTVQKLRDMPLTTF